MLRDNNIDRTSSFSSPADDTLASQHFSAELHLVQHRFQLGAESEIGKGSSSGRGRGRGHRPCGRGCDCQDLTPQKTTCEE